MEKHLNAKLVWPGGQQGAATVGSEGAVGQQLVGLLEGGQRWNMVNMKSGSQLVFTVKN